jgi:hypothetical protein
MLLGIIGDINAQRVGSLVTQCCYPLRGTFLSDPEFIYLYIFFFFSLDLDLDPPDTTTARNENLPNIGEYSTILKKIMFHRKTVQKNRP